MISMVPPVLYLIGLNATLPRGAAWCSL